MKRLVSLFLLVVMMLSFTACQSNESKNFVGETVSTECGEFTLRDAAFTISVENSGSWSSYTGHASEDYFTPTEYAPGNPFSARKGSTLVWLEFEVKNTDRDSFEYGSFGEDFGYVRYKNKTYHIEWYEDNGIEIGAESIDGNVWTKYDVGNILLLAGESVILRCYIQIPIEPDNMNDEFEFVATLPLANGKMEEFSYVINKKD